MPSPRQSGLCLSLQNGCLELDVGRHDGVRDGLERFQKLVYGRGHIGAFEIGLGQKPPVGFVVVRHHSRVDGQREYQSAARALADSGAKGAANGAAAVAERVSAAAGAAGGVACAGGFSGSSSKAMCFRLSIKPCLVGHNPPSKGKFTPENSKRSILPFPVARRSAAKRGGCLSALRETTSAEVSPWGKPGPAMRDPGSGR